MNAKLAKKYREAIGNITGVAKSYLTIDRKYSPSGVMLQQVIVDPNSNHGIYKRVKKAKLTAKLLGNIPVMHELLGDNK